MHFRGRRDRDDRVGTLFGLQLLRRSDSSGTKLMASRRVERPSVHDSKAWQRRRFLVLLGLSLTSAGLAACGGDGGGDGGSQAIDTQQLPTPYSFPGTSDKDSVHDSCIPGHPGC